ncbi:MAG: LEA type 2 family protein [Calditrichaeota bacterium]|nr:LEA type 2 family protein [Calditrichota bacterium]
MKKVTIRGFSISVLLFSLFTGCSILQDIAQIQKPDVAVQNVRFTGLDFEKLSMVFDIGIQNPNKMAVNLAGLNYELFLNDNSFLKGEQSNELTIASEANNVIEIPLDLSFSNIYSTIQSLKDRDSTSYRMNVGLLFNLPVLGPTNIPISKEGGLPLLKWPSIQVASLDVQRFNLTGAALNLKLQLENPNSLNLLLNKLNYNFKVNGNSWISGETSETKTVSSNNETSIDIPFQLDFLKMGQTVYQMISGGKEIQYDLTGNMNLGSTYKLLEGSSMPFNKQGTIKIQK